MEQQFQFNIRRAGPADVDHLAQLADIAGEGLPSYLWARSCGKNETVWEFGRQRALRESGTFSYRNASIADGPTGTCAGCMIGYPLPETPEPVPDDTPNLFRPLLELESRVAGSWYVNVLAVYPRHQNHGCASALLQEAHHQAASSGCSHLSIIVTNANAGARRLYERVGFKQIARQQMVKENWINDATHWIVMDKPR